MENGRSGRYRHKSAEAQKPPYVEYAAEAAFTLHRRGDHATKFDVADKHKYTGGGWISSATVDAGQHTKNGKYQMNAEEAQKWDLTLETRSSRQYESARLGSRGGRASGRASSTRFARASTTRSR